MCVFRVTCSSTLMAFCLFAVLSNRPLIAAPGDLDPSFDPAFDDIAAVLVRPGRHSGREWKMAVQRANGTVAFLDESGRLNRSLPISPGNVDYVNPERAYSLRGFHAMADGRIVAMDPARIINPDRGLSWPLFGSDTDRAVDGAVFEDNSVLLGRSLIRLSSTGFRTTLDPTLEHLGSIRHFVPSSEGRWFMQGQDHGPQYRLWRLTPSGSLDETFESEVWQCSAVVAADAGKSYVAYNGFNLGYPTVVRLLSDGRIDWSFEPVEIDAEFGLGIRALAFDPKSGGVFVGINANVLAEEASRPSLYYIDREGEVNAFFTENAAVEGSISRLTLADDRLYVLGELKKRGESEVTSRIVRLEANTDEFGGPQVTFPFFDAEIPVGRPYQMSVDVGDDEISYQWFKNGEPL